WVPRAGRRSGSTRALRRLATPRPRGRRRARSAAAGRPRTSRTPERERRRPPRAPDVEAGPKKPPEGKRVRRAIRQTAYHDSVARSVRNPEGGKRLGVR